MFARGRHAKTGSCRLRIAVIVGSMVFAPATLAQQQEDPAVPGEAQQTPAPESELTPEELKELEEIERALAGDATAQQDAGKAPPPAPATNPVVRAFQSLNPDISLIGDFTLAAFTSKENLQGGGHDPTRTGFNLQQLEMTIGASVDPFFRFDANLVFAQSGVEIEEAYATTLALPGGFQGRVGQFLTRFGRQNATHPHAWDFVDQHFILSRFLGSEGNRGLGVEASYLTPLPWYVELVGSVTEAGGEATARSFFGGNDLGVSSPLDFQFTGAIKQFFELHDDLSLLVGASGANGPNPTGYRNRSDLYGVDVYLKYRPLSDASTLVLSLQTEWMVRRRQLPDDVLTDFGGYVVGFWRFEKRWAVAARYEYGSPAVTREGRTAGELDYLDPMWNEPRHRVSSALTFWPTEFSRARLQLSADYPLWREDPIYAAFLAFEISIGAHGAHKF